MALISFGEYIGEMKFKVLDERAMRASSGIMLLLGFIAFTNGFIINNYAILPYISGFLMVNFIIGIFINPKFAPTMLIGRFFVRKQSPLYIGAIQKKFAWSMGLILSLFIFGLSIMLLGDVSYFEPVCLLCIICLIILFFETAFGICVGCKVYNLAIRLKLLKKPIEKPNCMGDACSI